MFSSILHDNVVTTHPQNSKMCVFMFSSMLHDNVVTTHPQNSKVYAQAKKKWAFN